MVQPGSQAPTVLLVDDEADVRLLWRMVFALHGGFGAISEAADGGEALEMLETKFFDVVVTDFSMPGVSGLEVLDATLSGWPSTVVVMVSATTDVGHEALRRGASAFFDKWESTTHLLPRFVTAVLAEHEAQLSGPSPAAVPPEQVGRGLDARHFGSPRVGGPTRHGRMKSPGFNAASF